MFYLSADAASVGELCRSDSTQGSISAELNVGRGRTHQRSANAFATTSAIMDNAAACGYCQ